MPSRKKRKRIPVEIRGKVLLYCRYECCLCDRKISGRYERNIHHINNDPSDNRIENLMPLCPTCHAKVTRGDFSVEHLRVIREAKIRKLGIRDASNQTAEPAAVFKAIFGAKLDDCLRVVSSKRATFTEFNDLIDELIMLMKERIEKWDVPSVRFGTRELFMKLYEHSEKEGICDLYTIFEDLFNYAYYQRKHILGTMIHVFVLILLQSWVPEYDIEKAEKGSDVLLKLSLDFLDKDLQVSEVCFTAIDNLAGDMWEPEVLSKEIILGASVFARKNKSLKMCEFLEKIVDYIQWNDKYAGCDGDYRYLIESLNYAEVEQPKYSIDILEFKEKHMIPALKQNMSEQINSFIEYLSSGEYDEERREFVTEDLCKLILSYESVDPNFHEKLMAQVAKTRNTALDKEFNKIIEERGFLKRVFQGSEMITTIPELIEFLEKNSDIDNVGIGVTTYGPSWITFKRKIGEEDKKKLGELAEKYNLHDDSEFEIIENEFSFLMDRLVYLGNNRHDMKRLIQFLKDINNQFAVKSLTTGVTFQLRNVRKT